MHERIDFNNILLAVIFAVLGIAVPALFHAIGLGSMFLPMYLPLSVGAFLLKERNAFMTGALTPLLSGLLTGMPPFYPPIAFVMAAQLGVFCLMVSLLTHRFRWNIMPALITAVVSDRVILFVCYYFILPSFQVHSVFFALYDVAKGIPGIAIMFAAVPSVVPRCIRIIQRNTLRIYEQKPGEDYEG
jgi:hypothetical protein